jgi:hypothetical protein
MKPVSPIDAVIYQMREHIKESRARLAELVAARDRARKGRAPRRRDVVKLVHPVTGKKEPVKVGRE